MNSFLVALQFLTILPVPHTWPVNNNNLGFSTVFYPLIGLIIGGLLVIVTLLCAALPIPVQAAILLTFWAMLTGGLHLDGLADCADAWVGGLGSKNKSLELMKDPAAGPIAVTTLILILLLKWTLLCQIIETHSFHALLLTPMLGRTSILMLMLFGNYIRTGGLAEKLIATLPAPSVKVICLFSLLLGSYFLTLTAIISMLLILYLINFQAEKRLGGLTGDVYGAAVELTELSVLLGVLL